MMGSSLSLVVFDMAGTTVEDRGEVNRCFREALGAAGLTVEPEWVDAVMGLRKPEAIRELIESAGRLQDLGGQVPRIHDDFVARMLEYYRRDPGVRAVPGIEDVLRQLRSRGLKLSLDTGFSADITAAILDRLGWVRSGLIDAHVSSDQVAEGRPAPDMIRHLMQRLGVDDIGQVAKVGDAPADLNEGHNAGCRIVVGVTWGSHTRDQLARHPHTALIDRPEELLDLVGA